MSLYGCPECQGPDCGVITARLDIDEDTVTWRAIAEQYEYTDELVELGTPGLFPNIRFERHTYEAVLRRELDRVRPMLEGFEYPYQRARREKRERRRAALLQIFGRR